MAEQDSVAAERAATGVLLQVLPEPLHKPERSDSGLQQESGADAGESLNGGQIAEPWAATLARQPEDGFVAEWLEESGAVCEADGSGEPQVGERSERLQGGVIRL